MLSRVKVICTLTESNALIINYILPASDVKGGVQYGVIDDFTVQSTTRAFVTSRA